jgi:1-phosphofructokinase family hexose kinase
MLLVVCPNLAVDRILQLPDFEATKVQRSRSVLVQPGGKGSNVARVFRQLGGDVVLVGCVGKQNGSWIVKTLREAGIHVDSVTAYSGESRTCTIICDPASNGHPTVINEESPEIEPGTATRLLGKIERWIPRVDAVLTTGSLSQGLKSDFYAEILDRARSRGKLTAIDAAGDVLRFGMLARPVFMKPNLEEFRAFAGRHSLSMLAPHTVITFQETGAILIYDGNCMYAPAPRVETNNPIGAGDAFAAGYLRCLLDQGRPENCLRWAVAAAACDAATLRPGHIDRESFREMLSRAYTQSGTDVPARGFPGSDLVNSIRTKPPTTPSPQR